VVGKDSNDLMSRARFRRLLCVTYHHHHQRTFVVHLLPQADLGIHIWGGKLFRGPEGRERGCGLQRVWESVASSPSGVWGGAPAEIEFGAF